MYKQLLNCILLYISGLCFVAPLQNCLKTLNAVQNFVKDEMKKKFISRDFLIVVISAYLLFNSGVVGSQSAFVVSGGKIESGMGSFSLSVGQPFYEPLNMDKITVHPGVQQPYEWFVVSTIEVLGESTIRLWPNPTLTYIKLEVSDFIFRENLQYFIIDLLGREFDNGQLLSTENLISVESLPAGSYFITLFDGDHFYQPIHFLKL